MNDDELISVFDNETDRYLSPPTLLKGVIPNELMESGVEIGELQIDL